ncbi:hypothetical protein C364_04919 [Cryptococcus neoformans Bt63]|nr:hypothetical protein C364_04919 [Cryptococcus neoformans var. grubii Bt63]
MSTPYEAHNFSSPPPPKHASSSSSGKKAKQKRPSFSNGTSDQNTATAVRAFSACRNCRNKKVKCLPGTPLPSTIIPLPASPTSLGNSRANLGPCQQCLQSGAECIYPPTRDRAAYSRQYVANLETRVQNLEMVQARLMPLLEAFEASTHSGKPMPMSLPPVPARRIETLAQEMNVDVEGEGEPVEDGATQPASDTEDVGQITQDDRGNYRWIGSSNTLSLLDSFSGRQLPSGRPLLSRTQSFITQMDAAISSNRTPSNVTSTPTRESNPYFGPVAGSGVVKALPSVDEVQYPSAEKSLEMVDAFFQEVHPCLPVLLEHEFRRDFRALMEARARGDLSWGGGFISVVFAIFALGERAIVTSRAWRREMAKVGGDDGHETVLPGEAEAGVIWYERAQILHYTTLKDVNIHQVQCLTLLAAFQASVNAMPMSWLLAGQAIRVAQDLGLHRSTARLPLSFAEKQLRSRCWWAIYGLERMMSVSLGRPLGVDDLDVDVAYPLEVDDAVLEKMAMEGLQALPPEFEKEPEVSTMSGFIALTKLCKIAGRVVHLLYRPSNGRSVSDPSWAVQQQNAINKLDKLLRDWLANDVPSKYKDPSETHSVSLLSAILSNSYFTVLVTLHRNFLPSSPDYPRPKPPPSSQSLAHCVDAARSVIHIASQSRTLVPPSHHLAMYCQYLWSSAVILLLCEIQARDQVVIEAVGSQVEACRKCLQALEPVWPGSKKLKELLNDVASRAKEVMVSKPSGKKRKSSAYREMDRERPMLQRSQGHQSRASTDSPIPQHAENQWQSHSVLPSEKKQRVYEVSDTRTASNEDEPAQNPQAYYSVYPMTAPTSQAPLQFTEPMPTYDMVFDLGGVTFDGLELLQGFSGGASDFWNNFNFSMDGAGYDSTSGDSAPVTRIGQQFLPSGQLTPDSNGDGSRPSSSSWQGQLSRVVSQNGQQYVHGQGQDGYNGAGSRSGGVGTPNALGVATFWEQVTGSTFDWQADPNVPFNI